MKKFKLAILVTMIATMLLGNSLTVFATGNIQQDSNTSQAKECKDETIKKYIDNGGRANGLISEVGTESLDNSWFVYWDGTTAWKYKVSDVDDINKEISKQTSNKTSKSDAKQQVDDIGTQLMIEPDNGKAVQMLKPFVPIVNVIIGIIMVILSLGLTVFSGFDLLYLAFPVFRNYCDDQKTNGGGAMTRKGSDGEIKFRFISDEAVYAVSSSKTAQEGKSPYMLYFKKRIASYLVIVVLMFILLTGRVTIFTDIALKLVGGFLDIIQDFF